jgi:twitching motility protein PilJ
MSTPSGGLQQRESQTLNAILGIVLAVALLFLFVNFFLANKRNNEDRGAIAAINEIQVRSQQIAKFAAEAAGGNLTAFAALQDTRDQIDLRVKALSGSIDSDGVKFPSVPALNKNPEVGASVKRLGESWNRVQKNANDILTRRSNVGEFTDISVQFLEKIVSLSVRSDQLAKSLADVNAPQDQIYVAARQVAIAERLSRRLTEIQAAGENAPSSRDGFLRDSQQFGRTLDGLQSGNPELGISQVRNAEGLQILQEVKSIYTVIGGFVDGITKGSDDVFAVKESSGDLFLNSATLLTSAQGVEKAFSQQPSNRTLPSVLASIVFGILAALSVVGLLLLNYRDQQRRYKVTADLNQRNQEAILRLLDEMGSLAEGDLTVRATVTEDITGAIADSINFAVEALRSLVTTINETAVQVAAAAQETQATAMHLAEAAEQQAQQITSASAAINEIAVSIDEVSKNSAESADVAQRSVQIAGKGAAIVRQTIQGMDNIRDQIQETSKRIKRLGESSQEIGSIVELINDIAEQTNILALNAAIQAASAGDAGRGFAVVADEVQRLAERASNATKRIETLVQTIQSDTNEAVTSMEQTTAEVVAGARLAEDAGLALGEIEKVSNDLADLIQNISEAARQQSAAATNISATMNVIQEITTQTSVGASQTAESIGNLAQLAADLRRSVADFKLPS